MDDYVKRHWDQNVHGYLTSDRQEILHMKAIEKAAEKKDDCVLHPYAKL